MPPTHATFPTATNPRIEAVSRVLPKHYARQDEVIAALQKLWSAAHYNLERLADLHRSARVEGRYLALPLDAYPRLTRFKERNDAWLEVATELGVEAVSAALERAGLAPHEVDHLFFVTVTGIATPGVDARLVDRLGLRPDVKRTPIFGLGCVAGAAGLSRASDVLRAFPEGVAVLLSVELCSLTLQREDLSMPNIIASGLFGDGGAAVVLSGASRGGRPGPRVVATRSVFYPGTERIMGWDVVDSGLQVVLSAKVPELVKDNLGADVDAFLGAHGLARSDIGHWIAHTGGPKVLEAIEQALTLPPRALDRSWQMLRQTGNLSSASVLFVLADLLASDEARPGELGVMLAMGPGFCSELLLLQW